MMRDVLVPPDIRLGLPPAGSALLDAAGTTMGTSWSARLMLPPGARGDVAALLQGELDEIVAQMSHWESDSLLARYNRAGAGSWHALPPQFYEVVEHAMAVALESDGAYDPFAGELVNLWGFGPTRRYDQEGFHAPSCGAVGAVLARRAARQPELDRQRRRLLQPGGLLLDLSSVAKGYAVDRLALCLERLGVHHYLVEVGGELRGAGVKADGQPWWVELEGVPDTQQHAGGQAVAALHGLAVATSGDYRRYFHQGARRVSHTLDPRTGYPISNDVASVTVLAPTCMAADAVSTALTVLGLEAGIAFADARNLAARFLLRRPAGLQSVCSSAWRALL
jgi:thiamine biosynthesis lipoprotein